MVKKRVKSGCVHLLKQGSYESMNFGRTGKLDVGLVMVSACRKVRIFSQVSPLSVLTLVMA